MDSEFFNCSGGLHICTIAHCRICTFAHSLSENGQMCKNYQFLCKKCAKTIKRYLEFGAVFFFSTLKESLCSFIISFFGFRRELHSWIEQRKVAKSQNLHFLHIFCTFEYAKSANSSICVFLCSIKLWSMRRKPKNEIVKLHRPCNCVEKKEN